MCVYVFACRLEPTTTTILDPTGPRSDYVYIITFHSRIQKEGDPVFLRWSPSLIYPSPALPFPFPFAACGHPLPKQASCSLAPKIKAHFKRPASGSPMSLNPPPRYCPVTCWPSQHQAPSNRRFEEIPKRRHVEVRLIPLFKKGRRRTRGREKKIEE